MRDPQWSLANYLRSTCPGSDFTPQEAPFQPKPEILLHPQIPKPMHGLAPRTILGEEWWNETRRTAYASTGYRCAACGVHQMMAKERAWLEGHELYEIDYRKGLMTYLETVPLCHYCHNFIHLGRLETLRRKGEVSQEKYDAVFIHGYNVLLAAGLWKEKKTYKGYCARWKKWRLVLFGKKYKSKFKSEREWRRFYKV